MNNNERFLPLGSVVLLKNATKRLMITGYCAYDKSNQDKAYDYCGCLYPEGILTSDQLALFNNNQIAKVFYMGYSDEEDKEFKLKLYQTLGQLKNGQNLTQSMQNMNVPTNNSQNLETDNTAKMNNGQVTNSRSPINVQANNSER